jgi:hypothetical protein
MNQIDKARVPLMTTRRLTPSSPRAWIAGKLFQLRSATVRFDMRFSTSAQGKRERQEHADAIIKLDTMSSARP